MQDTEQYAGAKGEPETYCHLDRVSNNTTLKMGRIVIGIINAKSCHLQPNTHGVVNEA